MSTSVKITVVPFDAMTARGEFDPVEENHVTLIRGEIVPRFGDDPRSPMNPPHAHAANELLESSFEVAPRPLVRVSSQASIRMPGLESQPQPDLAWLARKNDSRDHPTPEDVALIIEVSDSSLRRDRGTELALSAEAGIREYWVVDLRGRCLVVHREPRNQTSLQIITYRPGEEARPLAFPDVALPVARLFSE